MYSVYGYVCIPQNLPDTFKEMVLPYIFTTVYLKISLEISKYFLESGIFIQYTLYETPLLHLLSVNFLVPQ